MAIAQMGSADANIGQMGSDEAPGQMGGRISSPTHQVGLDTGQHIQDVINASLTPEEIGCLQDNIYLCSPECQTLCLEAQKVLQQNSPLDPGDIRTVNALQALFVLSHFRGVGSDIGQYFMTYGASLRSAVDQAIQAHNRARDLWKTWGSSFKN